MDDRGTSIAVADHLFIRREVLGELAEKVSNGGNDSVAWPGSWILSTDGPWEAGGGRCGVWLD
jgi:hypothetical protein